MVDRDEGGDVGRCRTVKSFVDLDWLKHLLTSGRNLPFEFLYTPFLSMTLLSTPDWVFCTYCIHSPVPAVRSCLVCDALLCDDHLTAHKTTEHVLSDPVASLGKSKVSVHERILQNYCSEEVADSQSKVMGQKLKNAHKILIDHREKTEKTVYHLQERRRKIQETAVNTTEKAAVMFRDMRRYLEDLEQRVFSEIARQEEQASLSVSDLIQQLELKREELSRKICHIKTLCHMTDPLIGLQESPEEEDMVKDTENDELDCYVNLNGDLILDTLYQDLSDIVITLQRSHRFQERSHISMDMNTVVQKLYKSPQMASPISLSHNRLEFPLTSWFNQVFSSQSFSSGRHYWHVETNVSGEWRLGVSYYGLDRDGDQAYIGSNSKSWCLWGYYNNYYVLHDRIHKYIPRKMSSYLFRVYLDYEAGQLSFYEMSDPARHLYTFSTKFTEPLHAAFFVTGGWILIRNQE
ncbi:E3 ubiquitin/ISG15 ligase TRIM25-like [Dendropsophus ebraccatus]|uniref:E3 ubiquitin/ISG15 ligase TRIM25-like n=1 Tax=Dendropsophus ebraccatus TaxID=150705 RepID=UPI0038322D3C